MRGSGRSLDSGSFCRKLHPGRFLAASTVFQHCSSSLSPKWSPGLFKTVPCLADVARSAGGEEDGEERRKRRRGPVWTAAGRRVSRDNLGRVTKEVVSKSECPQLWSTPPEAPTTTIPSPEDTKSNVCNQIHFENVTGTDRGG